MQCEICHDRPASVAIGTDGDGEELYVCEDCAKRERTRRKKRREHTRKAQESMAQAPGDETPPILRDFFNAVTDMVDGIEKAVKLHEQSKNEEKAAEKAFAPLKGIKVPAPYLLRGRLHLEGIFLIGEMDAVHRAVDALGLRLESVALGSVNDVGHIYRLCHSGDAELAKRTLDAIVRQERNARIRLYEEMPRVFGDSLCRALGILKNCRLLSPSEYFDLLSPLRLAALENMLEGIKGREIEKILASIPLDSDYAAGLSVEERDAEDAARADEVNRRFEDVFINDRAEGLFR